MRFASFLLLILPGAARACQNCYGSSPNLPGLVKAAFFLLPLPFILVGLLFAAIRRQVRRLEEDNHG
jgi:hypothetical protein